MALKLVSAEKVPVTVDLAMRFRDMKSLKNERELKAARAKRHCELLAAGNFFTAVWGECHWKGEDYRGNGNHTSHLLTACLQQTDGGLDETSTAFVETYLEARGNGWTGSAADLPPVQEGEIDALVERYTADNENDLVEFFRRYDPKESARSSGDLFSIHIGEWKDLDGLERKKVAYAVSGVLRAAKLDPERFGFHDDRQLSSLSGGDRGRVLQIAEVRKAARWIVETVPDESLYSKVAGAQVFAGVWAKSGPREGEVIVEELMRQIDKEEDPGAAWEAALNKRHNRPTLENLVNKGQKAVKEIMSKLKIRSKPD